MVYASRGLCVNTAPSSWRFLEGRYHMDKETFKAYKRKQSAQKRERKQIFERDGHGEGAREMHAQ
eukprot:529927-Pyramimonas_sp.AAC.1